MARPSKYDKEIHVKIARLCALAGMIDTEIAAELEIDIATLYRWKQRHDEFCDALKENKSVIDEKVKNKLLTRAMGYKYDEITTEEVNVKGHDLDGNIVNLPGIKTKIVKKHVLPDVTAQIFWLKNRLPLEWRDTKEINVDVNNFSEWVKSLHEEEK